MTSNKRKSQCVPRVNLRNSVPYTRYRTRVLVFCLLLVFFSLLVVASVQVYSVHSRGQKELDDALIQAVTAFRHTMARNIDNLSSQVELIAQDSNLTNLRQTLSLEDQSESINRQEAQCREYLFNLLLSTDADVLAVLDTEGLVIVGVDKPAALGDTNLTFEVESRHELMESSSSATNRLIAGQKIACSLPGTVKKYRETRSGYSRISIDGDIYALAVTPLLDKGKFKGTLLIGQCLSTSVLGDWSRGMMGGILAVVCDNSVLCAYDKRTATEPAPAMLSSLEEAIKKWMAPDPGHDAIVADPSALSSPGVIEVAGRDWKELSIELTCSDAAAPIGRVLFLGDTSTLDYEVNRQMWLLASVAIIVLLVEATIPWFCALWLLSPLVVLKKVQHQPGKSDNHLSRTKHRVHNAPLTAHNSLAEAKVIKAQPVVDKGAGLNNLDNPKTK